MYNELVTLVRGAHKVKVDIVPIVVGTLGVVLKGLEGWMKKLTQFSTKTVIFRNMWVTNRKVVDNGLYYLNMQFQPNPMLQNQENDQKPSKMA